MSDRLKAIKARLKAASPGPWRYTDLNGEKYIACPGEPTDNYVCDFGWHYDGDVPPGNPDFIAHAPEDVAWLLSQHKRLLEAAERWEKYAAYIEGKQVVAPLWDNILFDAARKAGRAALRTEAKVGTTAAQGVTPRSGGTP
jgi:hypothetical protein